MARTRRKATLRTIPTELSEQIKLCVALDKMGLLYYAVPNGGRRNYIEAVNLKRSGVKSGVPDICIVEPRGAYHGLYIELKRVSRGVVSDAQAYWLQALRAKGYRAEVCKGVAEALDVVREYLDDCFSVSR